MMDSSGNKQDPVPHRDYTVDEETAWSILKPVAHRWRVNLPIWLLFLGSACFGSILLFVRYDNPTPSSIEPIEIWVLRAIGLCFMLAPFLVLARLRTGFYDD